MSIFMEVSSEQWMDNLVQFGTMGVDFYRQHLLQLWSKRFLDATILEITQTEEETQNLNHMLEKQTVKTTKELKQQNKPKRTIRIFHFDPFSNTLYYHLFYPTIDGSIRKLLDRAEHRDVIMQECIEELINHKNVTCVVKRENAIKYT